ncbi:MAG: ATP-grasp domain-containing protein [Candidatus Bathyarchaeia archaeon]
MKVLVSDGAYTHTLSIVRSLGVREIPVWVIGNTAYDISFYSKYCKGKVFGPKPSDETAFSKFLCNLLRRSGPDLLIPVGFHSNRIVSLIKDRISGYVNAEVADYEIFEKVMNRRKTYELAEKLNVPFPKTFYPNDVRDVERLAKELKYPVAVKGMYEKGGGSVIGYPRDGSELIQIYQKIRKAYHHNERLPMIQEYVGPGNNYGFCALYQNGVCRRIFMFKELRSYPVTGGSSTCSISIYNVKLKEYAMKLLDALKWHGVAHVEFKEDKDRSLKLMEVNPKFWASLDIALIAGMDFPYFLYQIAKGEKLNFSEDYTIGLKYHWPFSKEVFNLMQDPRSFFRILSDSINPRVKSNIWLKDFKPNLIELKTTAFYLLKKL